MTFPEPSNLAKALSWTADPLRVAARLDMLASLLAAGQLPDGSAIRQTSPAIGRHLPAQRPGFDAAFSPILAARKQGLALPSNPEVNAAIEAATILALELRGPVDAAPTTRGEPKPLAALLKLAGLSGLRVEDKPMYFYLLFLRQAQEKNPDAWTNISALVNARHGKATKGGAVSRATATLEELKKLKLVESQNEVRGKQTIHYWRLAQFALV